MALSTGTEAPDFSLPDTEGEEVALSDFKGKEHVVLLFFPLAFSRVCTRELCTTRDNLKLYRSLDARILAVSVDSFFTLRAFRKANNLHFLLLSDFNREVSRSYDCLYEDYYGMKGVSKRATFVIDKQGVIRYSEVLDDSDQLPDFEAVQNTLVNLA